MPPLDRDSTQIDYRQHIVGDTLVTDMVEIPYRKRRYRTARGRQPRAHGGTPAEGHLSPFSYRAVHDRYMTHEPHLMEQDADFMMMKPTISILPPDRLRDLTAELRRHAPRWAERLTSAKTECEFLEVVCKLFNLSSALAPAQGSTLNQQDLSRKITQFISTNLHKGLTLKVVARFLGYSEKYCSELFRSIMGESFSHYLKRQRTDTAVALLTTTDKSVAEIAAALGFSDQFAFSHFFKRSTGQSPRDCRADRA